MKILSTICLMILTICSVVGCGGSSGGPRDGENAAGDEAIAQNDQVSISLRGLPSLKEGVYEVWLDTGSEVVSLARFKDPSVVEVKNTRDLATARRVFVTVEWDADTDLASPDQSIILDGAIVNGYASLAFPVDLSSARGEFIVWAYAKGCSRCENDILRKAAIWFADCGAQRPQAAESEYYDENDEDYCVRYNRDDEYFYEGDLENERGVSRGLTLPILPAGWIYEGWVEFENGQTLSTGQFSDTSRRDDSNLYTCSSDAEGGQGDGCSYHFITSGEYISDSPLNYPGEEFHENLPDSMTPRTTDITKGKVYITVEPDASNFDDPTGNTNPFFIRLLENNSPVKGTNNQLKNTAASTMPSGEFIITSE